MEALSDKQEVLFRTLYNFIHDERMNCSNLISMIGITFPDPEENQVSRSLNDIALKYLRARLNMGVQAMNIMYLLDEMITKTSSPGEEGEP